MDWLLERGATENDIMEDDDKKEFIMIEYENTEVDGYHHEFRRVYLPETVPYSQDKPALAKNFSRHCYSLNGQHTVLSLP